MRVCVNWLPLDLPRTRDVARAARAVGLWGIGIADSPKYGELFAACATALDATEDLVVTTCVTNPMTRHHSVVVSAARTFEADYPGRFRVGVGRGDSAVRSVGLTPATTSQLVGFLEAIRAGAPQVTLLAAASGPATARGCGAVSDGVIAGVGRDARVLSDIRQWVSADRLTSLAAPEVWGSLRLAVGRNDAEVVALRRRMVPRAVGAAHFAFRSTFEGKSVPEEYQDILTDRLHAYDYGNHGRSGVTSNARLFADRPDIEDFLVDRFAIVGTVGDCRESLRQLADYVDGVFLSILFEDALEQIEAVGEVLRGL
jgi:alkanesulfonate monooxygenase SsuD/methylene tetrahydromethanopterin reductase-like flavin-dependent oxidoreductase (luciferase family)